MPSFFGTPSYRIFELKPRYYEPDKERLGLKKDQKSENDGSAEKAKANIRYHYENRKKKVDATLGRQSLIRVAIIAASLSLMIFWLFY